MSEKNKAKVIKDHNFSPNLVARGKISKKTNMLAVVVSDITNPYFIMLVEQIEKVCLVSGYKVILFDTQSANKNSASTVANIDESIFNSVINSQLDGVIILGGDIDYIAIPERYLSALKHFIETIPAVIVGRKIPELEYPCIVRNQTQSVELVTAHLLENESKRPDAILAINDQVATGVIRALKEHQPSVPEDIAVASCEYFPGSEYIIPRITTVDHQNAKIGRR